MQVAGCRLQNDYHDYPTTTTIATNRLNDYNDYPTTQPNGYTNSPTP